MNAEKLKKLQAQVRIGGKGTPRRKKKIVHSTPATDDKKLQSSLKKLPVNTIPGIEEVNIIKNDGTVIHFNNPKAQASLPTNTFAITGHGENKSISEMLPGILNQLGPQDITHLKKIASEFASKGVTSPPDDDVPVLVQNFEEVAIGNSSTARPSTSTGSSTSTTTPSPSTPSSSSEPVPVPVPAMATATETETEAQASEPEEAEAEAEGAAAAAGRSKKIEVN